MMVDGKKANVPVGDEWVASYNPYLLLRFDCHIHVDVVTATFTLTLLLPLLALSTCLSTVIKRKTTPVRFDCHIHVDVVTATACIKYLFKYCHKTEDYARARIQGIADEIELYRKTRCISAAEATWRLLGFQ